MVWEYTPRQMFGFSEITMRDRKKEIAEQAQIVRSAMHLQQKEFRALIKELIKDRA